MTKWSKKQGIQHATRNATRNFDAKKLDNITTQLEMLQRPIYCEMNKIIKHGAFHTRNSCRETDILLNNKVHLQHDTVKIHGELGFENEKTLRRNADYLRAGLPLIIVNQDLAKNCNLAEADLAEYLFYHELSKINAMRYNEGK